MELVFEESSCCWTSIVLKVDDSGEVPLILQDNERLQMIIGEEDELPLALPIHVIATNDFLI